MDIKKKINIRLGKKSFSISLWCIITAAVVLVAASLVTVLLLLPDGTKEAVDGGTSSAESVLLSEDPSSSAAESEEESRPAFVSEDGFMEESFVTESSSEESESSEPSSEEDEETDSSDDSSEESKETLSEGPEISFEETESSFESEETLPFESEAPPIESEALPIESEAPPIESEAPPIESEAPPVESEAPPVESEAPPIESEAPPVESEAPPVESEAPPVESEAPPIESEAPPVESEAPPVESETPPIESEAPPIESEAPPIESEAPPIESEAPPIESETPPIESEAPPIESEAPPIESEAPPIESEAPPIESEAPPIESEAPSEPEPPEESSEDESSVIIDMDAPMNPLPDTLATNPVDSYFDNSLFVGYSIMMHFGRYIGEWHREIDASIMGNPTFCAGVGISFYADRTQTPSTGSSLPMFRGQLYNFKDLPAASGCDTMYIGLMGYSDVKRLGVTGAYVETVDGIQRILQANPNLNLVILACNYNTGNYSSSMPYSVNNGNILAYNNMVLDYCTSIGVDFVDVATPQTTYNGYLPMEYSSDEEYHIAKQAFYIWVDVLRDYAQKKQNGTWQNMTDMPSLPAFS